MIVDICWWIYGYGSEYMDPTGSNEIQVETNVISVNIVELVKKNGFDNIRLGTCAYEKWIYLFDWFIWPNVPYYLK